MKKSEDGGMADTSDLKSAGLINRVGSTPTPRTFRFYDEIADFTKEQYEFLKDRTPRVILTSLPVGSGRSWVKKMFLDKKRNWETDMCDKVENTNRNTQEVGKIYHDESVKTQPIDERDKIYLVTSIMLREDLGAIFTRHGVISLKGKGKAFVDVTTDDLHKIIHFAYQLLDHQAMQEVRTSQMLEAERNHLVLATKKTEERLKELR